MFLNTRDDAQSEFEFQTEMPGHVGRGWTLLQVGGDGKDPFMGYAVVSWNPDDPSDYLAAGWWFHFRNQQFPDVDPYHDDTDAYLFIDGPEIDPSSRRPCPQWVRRPTAVVRAGSTSTSTGKNGRES